MSALENQIKKIATDLAYDNWDRMSGYGLYHASPQVQAKEIEKAEKTVRSWAEKLTSSIREDEKNKIIDWLESDIVTTQIAETWFSAGDETRKFLAETYREAPVI